MLSGGIVGLTNLEQDFDPNLFLPSSSAPRQYIDNEKIVSSFSFKELSSRKIYHVFFRKFLLDKIILSVNSCAKLIANNTFK